jgi:hypothetical protein
MTGGGGWPTCERNLLTLLLGGWGSDPGRFRRSLNRSVIFRWGVDSAAERGAKDGHSFQQPDTPGKICPWTRKLLTISLHQNILPVRL